MPRPRTTTAAGTLLLVLATTIALPALAHAEIRRCTRADGSTLYTDRSCESLGAVEGRPLGIAPGPARLAPTRYRGGCARRLDDLVFEVGAAIDAGDTNRLARSYHWTGMSTRAGYEVIERLDAIARRPLLDIAPVHPEPVVASTSTAWPAVGTPERPVQPAPRRTRLPHSLRIQQTLGDGITPSTTVFGLRRHMDCWWITL